MEDPAKSNDTHPATTMLGRILEQKSKLQAAVGIIAFTTFVLSIARVAMASYGRTIIWVMVASLKTMIVLFYEIGTERKSSWHRFASKKANMILNILEPVFWLTALVLSALSLQGPSSSAGRALGGIIIVGTLFAIPISIALAAIFFREYKWSK
ncbi:Hypothetical protein D9617_18g032700 [Elsinoe fawcettii]|nr:Hypothetical protein D9617_18g032700 [Elsinoe fawcettii]